MRELEKTYLAWGFGAFLFLKIATAMLLDESMSVLAAAISALIGVGVMMAQTHYVLRRALATQRPWRAAEPIAASVIAQAGAVWLICQGFSPSFAETIRPFSLDRDIYFNGLGLFAIIAALPVLAHGAYTMWQIRAIYAAKT